MTNNLKCPFCSAELDYARDSFGNILTNRFFCPNSTCIAFGDQATAFLWTKIIDGKKAQEALKEISNLYNLSMMAETKPHLINWNSVAATMTSHAERAITKQENE